MRGSRSSRGSKTRTATTSCRLATRLQGPIGWSARKSLTTTTKALRPRTIGRVSAAARLVLRETVGVATKARRRAKAVSCRRPASKRPRLDRRPRPGRRDRRRGSPRRPRARRFRGAIGFRSAFGTEAKARRDVDDQPNRQRAFLDITANIRPTLVRGRVPIEMVHVVARFVRSQLGEGQSGSRPRR